MFSRSKGPGPGGAAPPAPPPRPPRLPEVQVRPRPPAAAPKPPARPKSRGLKAARRVQRSSWCGVTRARVVLPRGRKVSNSACGASQCPPAEQRSAPGHPLPCLSPPVATPPREAPLRPFSEIPPSLTAQVAQGEYFGGLPRRRPGSPRRACGRGSRDKCSAEGAGVEARDWAPEVDRGQWPTRIPSATGGIIAWLPHPSRANFVGPQPTPRRWPPPHPPHPTFAAHSPLPSAPSAQARPPQRACPGLGSAASPQPFAFYTLYNWGGGGGGGSPAGHVTSRPGPRGRERAPSQARGGRVRGCAGARGRAGAGLG